MDDQRVGTVFRSIRLRRRLRQVDLAKLAKVSPSLIRLLEHGHFDHVTLSTTRRVARALEIRLDLMPRWRGGDLDRLLNAKHSLLHELVARHLAELPDWIAQPEVSFAYYADRGIIDILAWHPRRRALLVIELKTDIVDVNELVGTVDRKGRNAIRIAIDRGWIEPRDPQPTVSIWVIVADGPTNRRRVAAHRTMLRAAFPSDGRSIDGWLRRPNRSIRALSFWRAGLTPVRRVSRGEAGGATGAAVRARQASSSSS
ncbi:MAG TPA: hypothetical protein VFV72_02110 [Candidatus Limnocylindrales bacterium]|nr:hypothetical protein [Candidatus Limnocylindrales bacterium]